MRLVLRLVQVAIFGLVCLVLLVAGSILLSPTCGEMQPDAPYDVAVVLSRGMIDADTLDPGSRDRTEAGVDLYKSGAAATLLMTGDAWPGPPSAAALMADLAEAEGVPDAAVRQEPASRSTLENARFSLRMLPPDDRILLVTEGFHLWRGWASFAWAGHPPEAICQSSPLAVPTLDQALYHLPREVLAWGANLVRAPVWSLADLAGVEDRLPDGFLQ